VSDLDTAKTILGTRLRLRNSDTIAARKGRDGLGESLTQEISDKFRAHPGPDNAGPSKPEDVDHGEYR
jgi:hypothetical protein